MERKEKKSTLRSIGFVFVILILIGGVGICVAGVVYPVIEMEHYNRVYQNPITVMATVTSHNSYDDDGDTDYRSYVSYTVEGTRYEDIRYEDEDTAGELTAVGTQVEIQVSPENPAKLLSDLKESGWIFTIFLPMLVALVAVVWRLVFHGQRSKQLSHTPDRDTIRKDAKLSICGRFAPPFFALLAFGYGIGNWRYSLLLWDGMPAVVVVCAVLCLWRVIVAIRDLGIVDRDEYELRRDTLVDKQIVSGDDSDTYRLYYRSTDGTWRRDTTESYYYQAKLGDVVLSVFLPKKKKPLLHYDTQGDAC